MTVVHYLELTETKRYLRLRRRGHSVRTLNPEGFQCPLKTSTRNIVSSRTGDRYTYRLEYVRSL